MHHSSTASLQNAEEPSETDHVQLARLRHRMALAIATFGCIALLLGGAGTFLWLDREKALNESGDLATYRVDRLAEDLQQSLKVAHAVIHQFDAQIQAASSVPFQAPTAQLASAQAELLAVLPLPFALHALGAEGKEIALVGVPGESAITHPEHHKEITDLAPGRWGVNAPQGSQLKRIVPLTWRAAPNLQDISGYGVDLSFDTLLRWLDRERTDSEDRASLHRINADGTTTLLARAPFAEAQRGVTVVADWVAPALVQPSGTLDLISPLDGVHRRVAYRRLADAADQMVVVYGAATASTLAPWRTRLPYLLGIALLLASGMAYGGWRLDRSLRELTESERRFQIALQSGHVWDWDIDQGTLRFAPAFLHSLGHPPVPLERQAETLFRWMVPEDAPRLQAALRAHVVDHRPFVQTFRARDSQGRVRWFDVHGQAFWEANGHASYMVGTGFEITERLALEEAQRQAGQQLDTVANASPVLFWTTDSQGQVDWVNRRWIEFTGRSLETELGDGWLQSIHPEDRSKHLAALQQAAVNRVTVALEVRLRHHSGEFRWVMLQCLPRLDADLNPMGLIGSCVGLDALKQAEAEARQRGALLERVFDVLQDMLFVLDEQGRYVHYVGAASGSLYAPPDFFLGRTIEEVLPAELAKLLRSEIALAQGGRIGDFDYEMRLGEGIRHFNARVVHLEDSTHCMVVVRDITEREALKKQGARLRRHLELQLRLANRFINLPLDDIDDEIDHALGEIGNLIGADRVYIFIYDLERGVAVNTHEWCAAGTVSVKHDLQALPIVEMVEWDKHRHSQPYLLNDINTLEHGPSRTMLEAHGVLSMATLPMVAGDACLGFVGFDSGQSAREYDQEEISLLDLFAQMLVNVRERQGTEAQLRTLASELEQRVKDRTRQLDASVKRLSQANRELESFAYTVSHDLKSPLRSMEGFASLLIEEHGDGLNDEAIDYLERIQAATRRMARLISDLLAYSRIEQFDQDLAAIQLLPAVTGLLQDMRNETDAQGATVRVEIPPELAAVAHPQGLSIVLRNLIDNALKFGRPGVAPEITIRAQAVGTMVRLSVIDRGQGFDMKYHDRIFAIFQRLHRPEEAPGTGIGLAMVHKAMERMDGRIWAESTPGEGASFHIELPRS